MLYVGTARIEGGRRISLTWSLTTLRRGSGRARETGRGPRDEQEQQGMRGERAQLGSRNRGEEEGENI